MKLSIVIPVYNEEKHIRSVYERLRSVEFPCEVEFVLVDDGSSDGSWQVMESLAANFDRTVVFRKPKNCGKGSALHQGFELATGEIIAIQDSDFEYDPRDLPGLLAPILSDEADVVYGSRYHKSNRCVYRTFHYAANRLLTLTSNLFSGIYLSDMETCYKVFRAEILKGLILESKRFGFEPEVTARIAKLKIRIQEHPVRYFPRGYAEGKKIGWKDGVSAIWCIIRYNLQPLKLHPKHPVPQKFLTSKRQWL